MKGDSLLGALGRGSSAGAAPPRRAWRSAPCGGPPRSGRRSRGYSFLIALRQCGHWVSTFFTPYRPKVSTFAWACSWKRYSFPRRRAASPVQVSSSPRMANLTSASRRISTMARETFFWRSSNAPAQPTKKRYSKSPSARGAGDVELLAPVGAPVRADAPRVALRLEVLEHAGRLVRASPPRPAPLAPQVHEPRDVLDEHRTGGLAPAAGGAGPERVRAGSPRARRAAARRAPPCAAPRPSPAAIARARAQPPTSWRFRAPGSPPCG